MVKLDRASSVMNKTLLKHSPSPLIQDISTAVVRSATAEDVAGMAQILVKGFSLVPWSWMTPIMQAGIQADLQSRMGRMNLYRAFVAVDPDRSGEVLGTVEVTLQKSAFGQPVYPYLASLTVASGYRRLGIARQLVAACEQQVYLWNRDDLYLHVLADNSSARRLYLRLGYCIHAQMSFLNPSRWAMENRLLLHRHLISRQRS
jgi:ribosomal protein S18 acetylase RimI-like enzyme